MNALLHIIHIIKYYPPLEKENENPHMIWSPLVKLIKGTFSSGGD
jgi:hypothetical protein